MTAFASSYGAVLQSLVHFKIVDDVDHYQATIMMDSTKESLYWLDDNFNFRFLSNAIARNLGQHSLSLIFAMSA